MPGAFFLGGSPSWCSSVRSLRGRRPDFSMYSSGISPRKREGRLALVRPKSIRWVAQVRYSFSLARVMAT